MVHGAIKTGGHMKTQSGQSMLGTARRVVSDLLFPPLCLHCAAPVGQGDALCGACWRAIRFIAPPFCVACGLPFEFETTGNAVCGSCLAAPPAYDRARAVCLYDAASRGLVLALKHGDRHEGVRGLALWMQRAAPEFFTEDTLIVPVPLHRWRLWRRRYNQSALLAAKLVRLTGARHVPLLLERHRDTASQAGLSRAQRKRNVAGAFRMRTGFETAADDRSVVLVDDVLTTGATVDACARVLKKAGAARVDVLTFARALPPGT